MYAHMHAHIVGLLCRSNLHPQNGLHSPLLTEPSCSPRNFILSEVLKFSDWKFIIFKKNKLKKLRIFI